MMMTVVTAAGKLHAAAAGDARWKGAATPAAPGAIQGGLIAGPGQTIHIIDVPDTFADLAAVPDELMARLTAILTTRGLL